MSNDVIKIRAENWLRILENKNLSGLVPICNVRDPAAQLVHVGIRSRGFAVEEYTDPSGETYVCARISDGDVWSPPLPFEEQRKLLYELRGVTIEKMVVALWERVVEGRAEESNSLQSIRSDVKLELPKQ